MQGFYHRVCEKLLMIYEHSHMLFQGLNENKMRLLGSGGEMAERECGSGTEAPGERGDTND